MKHTAALWILSLLLMLNRAIGHVREQVICDQGDLEDNKDDGYQLRLINSGPAVLDSSVTFHGTLCRDNGTQTHILPYKYVWESDACFLSEVFCTWITHGREQVNLSQAFTVDKVLQAGTYSMRVKVYSRSSMDGTDDTQVAEGFNNFTLTDVLNGNLNLSQTTTNPQRPANMFATGNETLLSVNMTDHFLAANYSYTWSTSRSGHVSRTWSTNSSSAKVEFNETGWWNITVTVNASVLFKTAFLFNATGNKIRIFSRGIELKDPIGSVDIVANDTLHPDDGLTMNIGCLGSGPFSLRCNITDPKGHSTDCGEVSEHRCYFSLPVVKLTDLGEYNVLLSLTNDVSTVTKRLKVAVVPRVSPVPAYIPVLCILVGVGVLAAILISYHRDKRKARLDEVERASFNFYMEGSGSHTASKLREVLAKLWLMLRGRAGSATDQTRTAAVSVTPPHSYGSLDNHSCSSFLTESL